MPINPKTAIDKKLVISRNGEELDSSQYKGKTTVDVTIREILIKSDKGTVIASSGGVLEPQQSAYLISEEIIHVPKGYIAYVFLKNRLSQQGLLAFNTGIIDSNFYGPISTLITNLSSEPTPIPKIATSTSEPEEDRSFFRITFHKIDAEEDPKHTNMIFKASEKGPHEKYKEYREWREKDLLRIPNSFLDPAKIKDQVSTELTEKLSSINLTRLGILIAILGLFFGLLPLMKHELYDSFMKPADSQNTEKVMMIEKRVIDLEKKLTLIEAKEKAPSDKKTN